MKNELQKDGIPFYEDNNASADSFYSSQGRISGQFLDRNLDLIGQIKDNGISTIDMETFQLYHLAYCFNENHNSNSKLEVAALMMVFGDRVNGTFLVDDSIKAMLEHSGGLVCLRTLIK